MYESKSLKVTTRFELGISCLLGRRFNQLSHETWISRFNINNYTKCSMNYAQQFFKFYVYNFFKNMTPLGGLEPPAFRFQRQVLNSRTR